MKVLTSSKPNMKKLEEFLESQTLLPLSFNFASSDDHIGTHLTGIFPKRPFHVAQGVYPKKGWLKLNLWEGFVDPKEHPRMYDPAEGFIVSANSIIASKYCKNGITHGFSFTHRYLRLREILMEKMKNGGKLHIDDMIEAQMDTLDY